MSARSEDTGFDPDLVGQLLSALRIERGHPEPEELAALTVVLTRLSSPVPVVSELPAPRSRWSDRRHALGLAPVPGPGGWQASALPR